MPLKHCDKLKAVTTSSGSLLQCLIALSVKKCFLMSSLTLPWHSFLSFPCIPSLGSREKRWTSLTPMLRKLYRTTRSPLSLLFPELEKPTVLCDFSQNSSPRALTSLLPSLGHIQELSHPSSLILWFLNHKAQNCTQRSRRGCTNAEQSGNHLSCTGSAVFDASWDAVCLPGWQGSLLTHTSHPSLQGCSPDTPFPIHTCVQSYTVPGTKPSICSWISCPWLPNAQFRSLCKASHHSRVKSTSQFSIINIIMCIHLLHPDHW